MKPLGFSCPVINKPIEFDESEWETTNALGASSEVRKLLDLEKVCISESEISSISATGGQLPAELEPFIQEKDLQQLLDLESSLLKMIQEKSLSDFIVAPNQPDVD
jgi:hypothetical protein